LKIRRNQMNKIHRFLAIGLLLLSGVPSFAQTVSTPVVGFYKVAIPAGSSFQGVNLVNPNLFSGTVVAVSGNVVSFNNASFTSSGFNSTDGVPEGEPTGLPQYYIEVQSGAHAGVVYDIISNATGSLTLLTNPPADIIGATIVVRKHVTLGQVAQQTPGLRGNVDSLTIYNPDGSQTDVLWDGSNWVDLNAFVYGDLYPIYPGQGFVLNVANSATQTVSGLVKTTPTVVPLYQGAVNVVTTMNPTVGAETTLGSANFGEFLTANLDTLSTFNTVAGQLTVSNDALIWDGALWADLNTFEDASGRNIDYTKPVIISVGSDTICKLPAISIGN